MKRKALILSVFVIILFLVAPSPAQEQVKRLRLQNGLTVILKENHAAPVVALEMWVKVGSRNETEEEAGISHLFEHMLFKGTKKYEMGKIAREVEARGGDINAFTSYDYTVYFLTLPSRHLDLGLDILSEAIFNSTFDPEEIRKEREVVLEEWRRGEDRPVSRLNKRVMAAIFKEHPYRRPIIGYEQTINRFEREDLIRYFNKWYRPDNMVLVLVGDFKIDRVRPRLERFFGSYPKTPGPDFKDPGEPPQEGMRALVIHEEVKEARMLLTFRIPDASHPDVPALDLMAVILGDGESSRLYRRIKEDRGLVHSIFAYSYTPAGPGLFEIEGGLEGGKVEKALKEVLYETFRLKYERVSEGELNKAKLKITSQATYDKETMEGEARKLGYYEVVLGGFEKEADYFKAIEGTTPEDIRRVARDYLKVENLTVGLLLPKDDPGLGEGEMVALARGADSEAAMRVDATTRKVFKNGLTLIVKENHAVPTVAIRIASLGGVRFENRDNNGINNLLARMFTRGTKTRSAEAIAQEVEAMAAEVQGFSGRNSLGLSGRFLSRDFERGLNLMADLLLNSTFPEEELRKVKEETLAAIKRREDELGRLAFFHFARTMYKEHPYGLDPLGTRESLDRLLPSDLKEYHTKYIVPSNLVLAVVGDVDAQRVMELVDKLFGSLEARPFNPPQVPQEPPQDGIRRAVIPKTGKKQVHIVLGFRGTTIKDHADRHYLDVLASVLSGQGGRLFIELRDKKALAYSVFAFSQEDLDPGYFAVYIATAPEKVEEAIKEIKRELKKVRGEEISPEELKRATQYLAGQFEIGLQSNSAMAADMAFNELYGLGYNYYKEYPERILKVTARDVLDVANKYIDLNRYTLTIVGSQGDKR